MIQRLQSLYLLFGALFAGLFLVIGDAWYAAVGPAYPWAIPVATILCALTVLVALGAVFLYKDRPKQRKVIQVAQWLDLGLVFVTVGALGALALGDGSGLGAEATPVYLVVLLPVVAYVFLRLALRGVEKDIALVRSMDRLR